MCAVVACLDHHLKVVARNLLPERAFDDVWIVTLQLQSNHHRHRVGLWVLLLLLDSL